jgi:hypothetical protein
MRVAFGRCGIAAFRLVIGRRRSVVNWWRTIGLGAAGRNAATANARKALLQLVL